MKPAGTDAAYSHAQHTIFLDPCIESIPRHLRATLAHELGHAFYGHDGPQHEDGERLADSFAARILVSPSEYVIAEQLHDGNRHNIAADLDVPVWIIDVYRATL
ncbi:ImmA/IrrE family metallo-endopeptidase [Arcanobacterium canis]